MRKRELARNLAVSLADCDWSVRALEWLLMQRLPALMQKSSVAIAAGLCDAHRFPYAANPNMITRLLLQHPEFDKIYRKCKSRNLWPSPDISTPQVRPTRGFEALELPKLATNADLADWLLLPLERLEWFADRRGLAAMAEEVPLNHYFGHLLKKPSGGHRLIEAPKPALKALQRKILQGILDAVPVHDAAFGFVPGRSAIQAASRHAGEEMVVCFDIRNFFPTVSAARIHALFRCLGYPYRVAQELTGLVTTITPERLLYKLPRTQQDLLRARHLPQGAPSSPALANLCAFNLDKRCAGLARSIGVTYTRYADDLTFSGDRNARATLLHLVPEILRAEGFHAHPGKTRTRLRHERQSVTGIVVNQHLNVPRIAYDRLKAILHACAKPEDTRMSDPQFRARLHGQIAWVEQLNPNRGQKLRTRFEAALA